MAIKLTKFDASRYLTSKTAIISYIQESLRHMDTKADRMHLETVLKALKNLHKQSGNK